MAKTKYVDVPSTIQIIASVYTQPSILDNPNYQLIEYDFPEEFHKILFGTIYNLYQCGAKTITIENIEDYLEQRPKKYGVYKANNGTTYLNKISEHVSLASFDYYYNRLKKMSILRAYSDVMDVSWLYDPNNILDAKKKQAQEDWLDNTSIGDIVTTIDRKIDAVKEIIHESEHTSTQAGKDILSYLQSLKEVPEIGIPLYGNLLNSITRGARLTKFYLRSAPTGVGKTRYMIADACNFACDEIYDSDLKTWVTNGQKEPAAYITTEQTIQEIQTMMVAFLADVDEEHILTGIYTVDEWERIEHAVKVLENSPLYIIPLSDFSLQDVEDTIRYEILQHDVRYVCHDYIHTSIKILNEISSKSGIKGLREDNILFMMSVRIKDLCNKYGVFIESATQLNGDWKDAEVYDQNLLRGAKAIADKIDVGEILLNVNKDDIEKLKPVLDSGKFETPNVKISIYKNRGGKYNGVLLWGVARRGSCRMKFLFVTDYAFELVPVEELKIKVKKPIDISAF